MADEIQQIETIGLGEDVDLFFSFPHCGTKPVNEEERGSLAFNRIKNGVAID